MVGRDGRLCKVFDLFAHDRDAALVGRVQFEHARAVQLRAEQLFAQSEDRRGFAGAGRTVEEHVRELHQRTRVVRRLLFESREIREDGGLTLLEVRVLVKTWTV